MKLEGQGTLLRVFIGESDRSHGAPLYERIVREARAHGLAGATVVRGVEGFGARSRVHTARILRLSEDLPVVVEIVDTAEAVERFVRLVEQLFEESGSGGMMTMEKVEIVRYTSGT
jgi:PII-like signaling protein